MPAENGHYMEWPKRLILAENGLALKLDQVVLPKYFFMPVPLIDKLYSQLNKLTNYIYNTYVIDL